MPRRWLQRTGPQVLRVGQQHVTVYLHGFDIEANVCLLGFWSLRCALAKSRHQHGNVADGDQIAAAEAKDALHHVSFTSFRRNNSE